MCWLHLRLKWSPPVMCLLSKVTFVCALNPSPLEMSVLPQVSENRLIHQCSTSFVFLNKKIKTCCRVLFNYWMAISNSYLPMHFCTEQTKIRQATLSDPCIGVHELLGYLRLKHAAALPSWVPLWGPISCDIRQHAETNVIVWDRELLERQTCTWVTGNLGVFISNSTRLFILLSGCWGMRHWFYFFIFLAIKPNHSHCA